MSNQINQNVGPISMIVKVDDYCPIKKFSSQDFTIQLGDRVLAAMAGRGDPTGQFSFQSFQTVPGMDGISLKSKPYWADTYCFEKAGDDKDSYGPIQDLSTINSSYIDMVNQKSKQQSKTGSSFYWWQSFIVSTSPVTGDDFDLFTEPKFKSVRMTGPNIHSGILDRTDILAIQQTANSPIGGVHWRLTKLLPVFMGQDFEINFCNTTIEKQINTFNQQLSFSGSDKQIYQCINPNATVVIKPNDDSPIFNAGVVDYIVTDTTIPTSTNSKTPPKATYTLSAVQKSKELYNLYQQPYLIIQVGESIKQSALDNKNLHTNLQNPRKYMLLITQKAHPILLQLGTIKGKWTSRKIATCTDIVGSDLLDIVDKLKISWVNHLGNFIITFNSLPPWVIRSSSEILTVPAATISIWGGFLNTKMYFSPLTHTSSAQMLLPPKDDPYQFDSSSSSTSDLATYLSAGQVGGSSYFRRINPQEPGIQIKNGQVYYINAAQIRIKNCKNPDGDKTDGNINFLGKTGFVKDQLTQLSSSDTKSITGTGTGKAKNISIQRSKIQVKIIQKIIDQKTLKWKATAELTAGDFMFNQSFLQSIKFTPMDFIKQVGTYLVESAITPILATISFALEK